MQTSLNNLTVKMDALEPRKLTTDPQLGIGSIKWSYIALCNEAHSLPPATQVSGAGILILVCSCIGSNSCFHESPNSFASLGVRINNKLCKQFVNAIPLTA